MGNTMRGPTFTFEPSGKGKIVVRLPNNTYLIDGKTGRPAEFDKKDAHAINYGGTFGELYQTLHSLMSFGDWS